MVGMSSKLLVAVLVIKFVTNYARVSNNRPLLLKPEMVSFKCLTKFDVEAELDNLGLTRPIKMEQILMVQSGLTPMTGHINNIMEKDSTQFNSIVEKENTGVLSISNTDDLLKPQQHQQGTERRIKKEQMVQSGLNQMPGHGNNIVEKEKTGVLSSLPISNTDALLKLQPQHGAQTRTQSNIVQPQSKDKTSPKVYSENMSQRGKTKRQTQRAIEPHSKDKTFPKGYSENMFQLGKTTKRLTQRAVDAQARDNTSPKGYSENMSQRERTKRQMQRAIEPQAKDKTSPKVDSENVSQRGKTTKRQTQRPVEVLSKDKTPKVNSENTSQLDRTKRLIQRAAVQIQSRDNAPTEGHPGNNVYMSGKRNLPRNRRDVPKETTLETLEVASTSHSTTDVLAKGNNSNFDSTKAVKSKNLREIRGGGNFKSNRNEQFNTNTSNLNEEVNTTNLFSNVTELKLCEALDLTNSSDGADISWNDLNVTRSVIVGPCPPELQLEQQKINNLNIWDQGLLSFQQLDRIRTLSRWVYIAILIPCPPLAVISGVVFTTKRMKNRVSALIVLFNVCEGLKSMCFIINLIWKQWLRNSLITLSSPYAHYFLFFVVWVPDSLGRTSLLVNMVVSTDRFIKLAFPLKSLTWKLIRYPKVAIALVIVIPLVVNASSVFLIQVFLRPKFDMSSSFKPDEIISFMASTDRFIFGIYGKVHIFSSICFRYIPLVVSISLSLAAVIALYRQQRRKRRLFSNNTTNTHDPPSNSSSAVRNRARQNNTMIVVSVLLFSFLVSIKPLVRIFSTAHPTVGEGKRDQYVYSLLNDFSLSLDSMSPIVNFLTYVILGSNFRLSLRDIVTNTKAATSKSATLSE